MGAPRTSTAVFTIRGPIAHSDLPGLCARLSAWLERSGADIALCEMDELVEADAVAIDALARLQLQARRVAEGICLCHASQELQELLAFVGLDGVVSKWELRVEPLGQAEQREQLGGGEEERELDDAPL